MTKYKLTILKKDWYFFKEDGGWVTIKYKVDGGLSRTQFRAMDIPSALQYVWSNHNGTIAPLSPEDLEEIEEVRF